MASLSSKEILVKEMLGFAAWLIRIDSAPSHPPILQKQSYSNSQASDQGPIKGTKTKQLAATTLRPAANANANTPCNCLQALHKM